MLTVLLVILGAILAIFLLTVFRGAPYVPTHRKNLQHAFSKVYPLSKKDLLVDIGSGDGVVLRHAASRGARAIGYEINPVLVAISWLASRRYGSQVDIKLADFWYVKLPAETTIVYTFGETRDIGRMYDKVQREATRLGKPLYFMSYGFEVPGKEVAKPDKTFRLYLINP